MAYKIKNQQAAQADQLTAQLQADPILGPILQAQAAGQPFDSQAANARLQQLGITLPQGTWISGGKVQHENMTVDNIGKGIKYAIPAVIGGYGIGALAGPGAAAGSSTATLGPTAAAGGTTAATVPSALAATAPATGGGFAATAGKFLTGKNIFGGLAAGIGGAFPDKQSQTTSPTMDPAYSSLAAQIRELMAKRLGSSADLSGYSAAGQQNINHTFDILKQSQGNDLTARGLSTSPVAGAVDATRENARGGQQAQFLNSIPLLQRELQRQDLGMGTDLLNFGRGSTSTATSGGGMGGAAGQLAKYIGWLQGQKAFMPPMNTQGGG